MARDNIASLTFDPIQSKLMILFMTSKCDFVSCAYKNKIKNEIIFKLTEIIRLLGGDCLSL